MPRLPAKVLEPDDLRRVLRSVVHTRYPTRNRVLMLLSFHAGLRACEMAGLTWDMVLGPHRRLTGSLLLAGNITKGGRARVIPASKDLQNALRDLHRKQGRPASGNIILSERGQCMSAKSLVNWFKTTFDGLGLDGCSSHSGRRTFITRAARLLAKTNGSLRDVQELAGHRALTTTERYIQGDRAVQRKLVNLI